MNEPIQVTINYNSMELGRIASNLKKIGKEAYQEGIKRGLVMIGRAVEGEAKRNAPVKTGRLRSSIGLHEPEEDIYGNISVKVGTNVVYAPFVEYGTINMQAHPFLRPAAMAMRSKAVEIFRREIQKVLQSFRASVV